MHSTIVNGKVLDWKFTKPTEFCYNFYIGDIYLGQIFKHSGWVAVSWCTENLKGLRSVSGFRTRLDAAEYLLRVSGYQE